VIPLGKSDDRTCYGMYVISKIIGVGQKKTNYHRRRRTSAPLDHEDLSEALFRGYAVIKGGSP
jgi:hypothetical protein